MVPFLKVRCRWHYLWWASWWLVMPVALTACSGSRQAAKQIAEDSKSAEEFDTNFTFNDVTLEDFDPRGRIWWKVQAKQATYNRDKKIARVLEPRGEFYQDGKPIIKVSAQSGEVIQNGKQLLLKGEITAIDTRNNLNLKGNELEWRPNDEILLLRKKVVGTQKKLDASAEGGRYLTRKRELKLAGNVAAHVKDPRLLLKTDELIWQVPQDLILANRPLTIERYKAKEPKTITDRAIAQQGRLDLKAQIVTVQNKAQLTMSDPAVSVLGNQVAWNLPSQMIEANQPVQIVNQKQRVTLSGDRGSMNLKTRMFYLTGNVQGTSAKNGATLATDDLTWNDITQEFEAKGNVKYSQTKPPFSTSGPTARGRLTEQQVVMSGGQVVTEFVPEARSQ